MIPSWSGPVIQKYLEIKMEKNHTNKAISKIEVTKNVSLDYYSSIFQEEQQFLAMVKLVNESAIFSHDDFKDWNWLFFNNKESDCILYSEDGHEFRIHKEILSQTKKMRNILSNSKDGCCGTMQIVCPCSKYTVHNLITFSIVFTNKNRGGTLCPPPLS